MRLVPATILAAFVLASASPAGARSGPPEPTESAQPTAGAASVETIGPDGFGSVPSPPIGPVWQVGLERSFWNVRDIDLVACGGGFTLLGAVDVKLSRPGRRYRPRALVWTSPDGVEWSRGGTLRPSGDPIADDWTVSDLIEFGGDLLALGAEDRRLVVWRSRDCGQTWRRLQDRPVFFTGRKAIVLNGIRAAATDGLLLVLGTQAGEMIPHRRWAWTLDDEHGWRRIRGGLDGVVDYGLVSDGRRFLATGGLLGEDAIGAGRLMTSTDGRHWEAHGVLPDDARPVVPDPARDRVFVETDVFDTGWTSPELQASTDDETWTPVLRATPMTPLSSGQLYEADGALVWIIDIWDDTDTNTWSWIGVSEDGGATWTVSAGQSGMQLAGVQSVAATGQAIVLAFTGEGLDAIRAWALPREQAHTAVSPTDAPDGWGPLAVVEGGGGPDARTGSGTLSIGADCVTFTADRTGEAVALVRGSDRTSWRPEKRLIVHTHEAQGTTRLSDGDRVWFGGMAIDPELEAMVAWLEDAWVQRPDPSCPTGRWLVGDVNRLE